MCQNFPPVVLLFNFLFAAIDDKTLPKREERIYCTVHITTPSGFNQIQPILDISNTEISKYPLTLKNIIYTHFLFVFMFQLLLSQAVDTS